MQMITFPYNVYYQAAQVCTRKKQYQSHTLWQKSVHMYFTQMSTDSNYTVLHYRTGCFMLTLSINEGNFIYRVIHKSLWDFRTRLHNNQDRHGRKEHINR